MLNRYDPELHKDTEELGDFDQLLQLAEALARSLGHSTNCKKVYNGLAVECTCNMRDEQIEAFDNYEQWKERKFPWRTKNPQIWHY